MAAFTTAPLDAPRWDDLVALFGPERGAYSRCWCMWWRVSGRDFDRLGGDGRRDAFRDRVDRSPPAGLLAYRDGEPVGWIAVGPRDEFGRLNRSPLLKPVDDAAVWSITCLYVAAAHRRSGVARQLIAAAVEFAAEHGAAALEAYPLDSDGPVPDASAYTGTVDMFTSNGFAEVARRRHRPILRREVSA
jgi:GNAT superfamily N-acetyltransferase